MALQLKAAHLREEGSDRKHVNAAVLRPLDGRDGFAFGIVSIAGRPSEAAVPAALVLEHVERLADAFGKDANVQHRFEQFLAALNETVAERVGAGEWNVPIQGFSAIVGIASENQMFLSGTGDLTALFLHRTAEQRYQVFNLFRSIQTEQALPTWEKAFAVVLDGDITPGDVFCASNRDLGRVIPSEELNAILSLLPPKSAAAKIRQYFPPATDLSLVVVQGFETQDPAASDVARPLASVSLDHLTRTQNETTTLLEDQKPKPFSGLFDRMQKMRAQPKRHGTLLRSVWRILYSSLGVAAKMLWNGARFTGKSAVSLTSRETRAHVVNTARTETDRRVKSFLRRFNGLPRTTKTLMLAAVGILFVLTASISVMRRSEARSTELAAYEAQVEGVERAMEKAAGAVIYKDENQARTLYAEASALAKALPTDTDARKETAAKLVTQIDGAFNELRHLVNIPQPTLLADFGGTTGVTGRALFSHAGSTYVFASDKQVYLLDAAKRTLTAVETEDGEIGVPTEVTSEDGRILFLDDRPELGRVDLENKLVQLTDVKPPTAVPWADLALYNGKLYVLEPSTGQIVRYNPAGGDYDGGTKWIRAKSTDLTDAVSLAIDATVFVLKRNGKIVRFVGGSEVGWSQGVADPPVTGASDIWTSADSGSVYVLDPATQRLIVYAKEGGALVTQYRSDAFTGLTDVLVDETNKTIYFLAGSKLYSITASHIK